VRVDGAVVEPPLGEAVAPHDSPSTTAGGLGSLATAPSVGVTRGCDTRLGPGTSPPRSEPRAQPGQAGSGSSNATGGCPRGTAPVNCRIAGAPGVFR
jgi:hypothetical protein